MEAPDWLMLRCGACRDELKIPRGLAVVYVRCPGCREVVAVPGGVLDPAKRFQVFDAKVAELPEVSEGGSGASNGGAEAIVATVDVPERRFGKPTGAEASREDSGGDTGGMQERKAGAPPMKALRKTEEFAKSGGESGRSHSHGHRGRRRGHDAPVWETSSRGRASSDRLAKRFMQLAVVGILVLGGGLGVMVWLNRGQVDGEGEAAVEGSGWVKPELVPVDLGGEEEGGTEEGDDSIAKLIAGVEAYYAAETVEELKRTVRDAARVGPLIEAYYAERGFKKMLVRSVAEKGLPVEDEGLWRVPVLLADRTERVVFVEQVGERYLVDWESYVGHAAMPWTDLVVKKPREEVTLRVWARADNYYNYDFSDEVALGCWRLSDPERQVQIYGYAPRGSDLAEVLEKALDGGEKALMVTFRYPEVARESRQVVLTAVAQEGWVVR